MITLLFAVAGALGSGFKAWLTHAQATWSKQSALDVATGAVIGVLFNLLLPSLPSLGVPWVQTFVDMFGKASLAQQAVLIAVFCYFASDVVQNALLKFGVNVSGSATLPAAPGGNVGAPGPGSPKPPISGGSGMLRLIAVLLILPLALTACATGAGQQGTIAGPLAQYKAFTAELEKGLPPGDPLLSCVQQLGSQLDQLDKALTKPAGPTAIGTALGDAIVLARRGGQLVALPGGGSLSAANLTPTACDAFNGMLLRLGVQSLSPVKLN